MTDPAPFVIIAHPRTGSTLLQLALNQNPHICQYGELFHDDAKVRVSAWSAASVDHRSPEPYVDLEDCARDYLRETVFVAPTSPGLRAVGFKLLYEQARTTVGSMRAWVYLRDAKDVRVIHVRRENLLECLVSERTAIASGVWNIPVEHHVTTPPSAGIATVTLDPTECEQYFGHIEQRATSIRSLFSGHRVLDLEYESDLKHGYRGTVKRAQTFLGAPAVETRRALRKQAHARVHERIDNWEQLVDHFRDSGFARFFEC